MGAIKKCQSVIIYNKIVIKDLFLTKYPYAGRLYGVIGSAVVKHSV